jgi:hypothetical protein
VRGREGPRRPRVLVHEAQGGCSSNTTHNGIIMIVSASVAALEGVPVPPSELLLYPPEAPSRSALGHDTKQTVCGAGSAVRTARGESDKSDGTHAADDSKEGDGQTVTALRRLQQHLVFTGTLKDPHERCAHGDEQDGGREPQHVPQQLRAAPHNTVGRRLQRSLSQLPHTLQH